MKWLVRRTACHFTRYKHVDNTLQNPIKRNFRSAAFVGTNETAHETVAERIEIGGRWPTRRGAFSSPISYVVQETVSSSSSSSFFLSSARCLALDLPRRRVNVRRRRDKCPPRAGWGTLSVLSKVKPTPLPALRRKFLRNRGQSQGGQRVPGAVSSCIAFFVCCCCHPGQGRRADRRGSVRCPGGSYPPSTPCRSDSATKIDLKI